MGFTRKPIFWMLNALFFLACVFYAWKNFDRAFPFINLDIKMDRKAALSKTSEFALQRGLSPQAGYQQAVAFQVDSPTQNFIELEAGGPRALKEVLKAGIYSPYTWEVRHFAQGVVNESRVRFTPEGRFYGLAEKISEDDPGAALSATQARALAEKEARGFWGVDLKPYHLIEQSAETRKNGRIDHSFMYERDDQHVGLGRYRLALGVTGSRLTEINPFIKVPEAFFRRFAQMRSANSSISALASAVVVLLYGIGFCGFGLFYLARRREVLWRMPVAVAAVISILQFLEALNRLPLDWMDYDTAISTQAFVVGHAANALLMSFFDFFIVVIALMAAESMSRIAFPRHPQLWRVFSRQAAPSRQIAGRVVGAYLLVGFHLAWATWIYIVGSQRLGWWNPSELLFHPDALATTFPWLTSIANSLHAGIWEECLFRAVPLAAAALLGNRYGKRGVWIACAFVLQALVFGAAHADYPTQPSYARLIELLVPSTLFGAMFLLYGLLPAMVMHYTYDVTLFAMPLFLSAGTSAAVSRVIVVALSGLPLWITLLARLRAGAWRKLPAALYNGGWKPAVALTAITAATVSTARQPGYPALSRVSQKILIGAGVVALVVWAVLIPFKTDAPGLKLDRPQAVALARATLAAQGVHLGADWQALAVSQGAAGEEDLFVWRTSGPEVYAKILSRYLEPPHWLVRFVRFDGDVAERAEEHQVFILGSGEIERVRHELPETRPGPALSERAARVLAVRALREHFSVKASELVEISSSQDQLPARRDWVFVWKDPNAPVKQGEARLAVKIAGDEVVGYRGYVFVPETWLRAERARATVLNVIKMIGSALLGALAIWIWVLTFRDWTLGRFDQRMFVRSFVLLIVSGILLQLNDYGAELAQFNTAQPWATQVLALVIKGTLFTLLGSTLLAMGLGRVPVSLDSSIWRTGLNPWVGYAGGFILAALGAVTARLTQLAHPNWPGVGGASSYFPWLDPIAGLVPFMGKLGFLLLLFLFVERRFTSNRLRTLFFVVVGLTVAAFRTESALGEWLVTAVGVTAVLWLIYELVARTSVSILIPLTAGQVILGEVRTLVTQPYPGAGPKAVLWILGVALVSWFWFARLNRPVERLAQAA